MLDCLDLDSIFAASRKQGFIWVDLFGEVSHHCQIHLRDKLEETRLFTQAGISIRAFDGKKMRVFSTTEASEAGILGFLEGAASKFINKSYPEEKRGPLSPAPDDAKAKTSKLSQIKKTLWGELPKVQNPCLQYEDRIRVFEVANSRGVRASSREEHASLIAHWGLQQERKSFHFRREEHRSSSAELFSDLERGHTLRRAIRSSLALSNPWPAPSGNIPIHWHTQPLATIFFCFLRGFEGDLFLKGQSFLSNFSAPFSFEFTIEDIPENRMPAVDNEGSSRRPVLLFDGKRPRSLACNNWIADQLSVTSTGHCRRESFRSSPTVGFWNPRITGHVRGRSILQSLRWGLSVHDLSIERFDPTTGDISILLREVFLVHNGEEGELVEPIYLRTNLLQVLRGLKVFSEECSTTGIPLFKQGQQCLVEVSAPSAISGPLPVPGRVPLNHYW